MRLHALSFMLIICWHAATLRAFSPSDSNSTVKPPPLFKIDVQWFLSYQYMMTDRVSSNQFVIKRGYLNFSTDLNDRFSVRITPDISQDMEGDGRGDIELRF